MKGILSLVVGGLLVCSMGAIAADAKTSMDAGWTCTTNASSSSVATDQAADKEMAEKAKSATEAFHFASQNCRDCTKITCEYNSTMNNTTE